MEFKFCWEVRVPIVSFTVANWITDLASEIEELSFSEMIPRSIRDSKFEPNKYMKVVETIEVTVKTRRNNERRNSRSSDATVELRPNAVA